MGLFLQNKVAGYDTGQTPQFGKIKDPLYDEGDFVFALRKLRNTTKQEVVLPKKKGNFSLSDLDQEAKDMTK